jgi:pimeloyl-ACP methyl ester carboxylesterase
MSSEAQGSLAPIDALSAAQALPVTQGRVRVGEIEVPYDVRGSGEPILLIPGLSMRRLMWPDALADTLAASGLQVVRMDNRDAGEGTRIKAPHVDVMSVLRRTFAGLTVQVPYQIGRAHV